MAHLSTFHLSSIAQNGSAPAGIPAVLSRFDFTSSAATHHRERRLCGLLNNRSSLQPMARSIIKKDRTVFSARSVAAEDRSLLPKVACNDRMYSGAPTPDRSLFAAQHLKVLKCCMSNLSPPVMIPQKRFTVL